jgi:hypothetical protein
VPFGFFSDSFYAWKSREWLKPYVSQAESLLISSEGEITEAQERFPSVVVSAVGNPTWEGIAVDEDVGEMSNRLLNLIDDTTHAILVPFNKGVPLSLHLARSVLEAAKGLRLHIVFAIHPGELKSTPGVVEIYEEKIAAIHEALPWERWEKPSYEILPGRITSRLSSLDVLQGVVLVVSSSSPTTDVQAVLLGVPTINYIGDPNTVRRIEAEFGMSVPPLAAFGAVSLARTPEELSTLLARAGSVGWGIVSWHREKVRLSLGMGNPLQKVFPQGVPQVGDFVKRACASFCS